MENARFTRQVAVTLAALVKELQTLNRNLAVLTAHVRSIAEAPRTRSATSRRPKKRQLEDLTGEQLDELMNVGTVDGVPLTEEEQERFAAPRPEPEPAASPKIRPRRKDRPRPVRPRRAVHSPALEEELDRLAESAATPPAASS
jgi:hypothetical protein